jgi:Lipocalin-like domain
MNRSMSRKEVGKVLLVIAAFAVVMVFNASVVGAQQAAGSFAQQIQGNWVLVSIVNEQDGKKIDVFGPNPRGSFILTPDGRFSMILMRTSLPKFASNSRIKGTNEENQAVVQGSLADFGRYAVESEKDKTLTLTIEGCTFPNWDGQTQKRIVIVQGDELRVTQHNPAIGGGTNYIVWKRAK